MDNGTFEGHRRLVIACVVQAFKDAAINPNDREWLLTIGLHWLQLIGFQWTSSDMERALSVPLTKQRSEMLMKGFGLVM